MVENLYNENCTLGRLLCECIGWISGRERQETEAPTKLCYVSTGEIMTAGKKGGQINGREKVDMEIESFLQEVEESKRHQRC